MKVYLAGPMRGRPNLNFEAFMYAAQRLREQGFEVFSPAEADLQRWGTMKRVQKHVDIRECLGADTAWICKHADAVALLPGYGGSFGALAEKALAEALGLTIIILGKEYINGK